MTKYKLTDGRIVTANENEFEGMAGEPMTVLQFTDESGKMVNSTDVMSMVSSEHEKEIREWIDQLRKSNYNSAVSWCI